MKTIEVICTTLYYAIYAVFVFCFEADELSTRTRTK